MKTKNRRNLIRFILIVAISLPVFYSCGEDEDLVVETTEVFNGEAPVEWTDLDLSNVFGENYAMVTLKVTNLSADTGQIVLFRQNGDTTEYQDAIGGNNVISLATNASGQSLIYTDDMGVLEWYCWYPLQIQIELVAYIK